jgi:GTPase SAR1 family protein
LVGDSGVGKSSILRRWATASFSKDYVTTVGADFVNTVHSLGFLPSHLLFLSKQEQ